MRPRRQPPDPPPPVSAGAPVRHRERRRHGRNSTVREVVALHRSLLRSAERVSVRSGEGGVRCLRRRPTTALRRRAPLRVGRRRRAARPPRSQHIRSRHGLGPPRAAGIDGAARVDATRAHQRVECRGASHTAPCAALSVCGCVREGVDEFASRVFIQHLYKCFLSG